MYTEAINSTNFWNEWHKNHIDAKVLSDDWLDNYASIIDDYDGPILDLGCGNGNNINYLAGKGLSDKVYACDQSAVAIEAIKAGFDVADTRCFNMLDGLEYEDNTFKIVIADLSLHYFTMEDTKKILAEIQRVLIPDGHLLVRVNSVNDIHHGAGQGQEIEPHLYRTADGMYKRFFDEADCHEIFGDFEILYCGEKNMQRYTNEKVVYEVCCAYSS